MTHVPAEHLPARRRAAAARGARRRSWRRSTRSTSEMQGRGRVGVRRRACTRRARRPWCAVQDGEVLMTDGPFVEGKEHLGGFTIVEAADLDAALEWAGKLRARSLHRRCRSRSGRSRTDGLTRRAEPGRDRAGLPRGVRPRGGRAGPRLRRHRRRRGGGPGRVRRGGAALAGRPGCRRARRAGSSRPRATGRSTACAARRRAPTGTRRPRCCSARRAEPAEEGPVRDDRLRLIFTCCHPALAPAAQVALTLRLLGGLTTAEIARAFLVPEPTHGAAAGAGQGQDPRRPDPLPGAARGRAAGPAARRARRRLPRSSTRATRPARASDWSATTCAPEAIRLGPAAGRADAGRARGARAARADAAHRGAPRRPHDGRTASWCRWPSRTAAAGTAALDRRGAGARAALPAAQPARPVPDPGGDQRRAQRRATAAAPTGGRSSQLYDQLLALAPNPVVALNRAVAVAEVDGPAAALHLVAETSSTTTTCSTRSAPTCCAASGDTPRRGGVRRGDRADRERGRAHLPGPPNGTSSR